MCPRTAASPVASFDHNPNGLQELTNSLASENVVGNGDIDAYVLAAVSILRHTGQDIGCAARLREVGFSGRATVIE